MALKYPLEADTNGADYVTFQHFEYRSNARGGNGPASAGSNAIVLYMPNNTPNVSSVNDWSAVSFPGPAGAIERDLKLTLAGAAADLGGVGKGISNMTESIQQDLNVQGNLKNARQAAMQAGLRFLLGRSQQSPAQLLAISRGVTYNPNVELAYSSPRLRNFSFDFNFVPKTAKEASNVNKIIREFKIWSAPKDLDNGMFEIPHVWQVTYKTGRGANQNMNKFKRAALTNVAVVNNDGLDLHAAHVDGVPIITTIRLDFQEVDIITRNDQQKAKGVGF